MQVTIEEIHGEPHTVVWHDCFSGSIGMAMEHGYWRPLYTGFVLHNPQNGNCDATALRALPRHPKPEDVKLLYEYMAHGLFAYGKCHDEQYTGADLGGDGINIWLDTDFEITHALNEQGERVAIAIRGET